MKSPFTLTRKSYGTRRECIKSFVATDGSGIEYYLNGGLHNPEHVTVTAFGGKRNKPDIYATYSTLARAEAAVAQWLKNLEGHKQYKAEQKASAKNARAKFVPEVGQIYVASWGYEQTNVDAYQTIKVVSNCTVVVRRIACKGVPGTQGRDCENVIPVPGAFIAREPELTKRVSVGQNSNGEVYASLKIDEIRTAHYEKTPRSHYCSWYY